jgi:tRNA (cmo5U34)-methyltransferase
MVDNEETMISNAKALLKSYEERIGFYHNDVGEFLLSDGITMPAAAHNAGNVCNGCDIIVSLFTLQFLRPSRKRSVFESIYKWLPDGGVFIYADKFHCVDSRMETAFAQMYDDFKAEQGLTSQEIINKRAALRGVQHPMHTGELVHMCSDIGFKTIYPFLQYLDFQGFVLVK